MAYSLLGFHGLLGHRIPKADGVLGRPKLPGRQTGVLSRPWLTAGVLGRQLPLVHPKQLARHVLLTRHLPDPSYARLSSAGPSLAGSSPAGPSLAGPSSAGPSTTSDGPVTDAGPATSAAGSSM